MKNKLKNLKTMKYGIIKGEDLDLDLTGEMKINYSNINWAQMKNYNSFAKNHCGATFITNLCIFFENQGFDGLLIDNDVDKTFKYIHSKIGNGPIVTVASKAKRYFKSRGYDLGYKSVINSKEIKSSIEKNHPLGILLAQSPIEWHWVLGVGYVEFDGLEFFRIINAWEDTDDRWYVLNNKAVYFSAKEYYIKVT
ncbi:MAG: hypothetical protein GXY87_03075 [Tissierellia bacterium]|nr:hypothetical protein [Tissierellia bacterium]